MTSQATSRESVVPDDETTTWRGHAVLQVPVPALEAFVAGRTAFHDAGFLGMGLPGEGFVHAHCTLLAPFDELPDEARVAEALQGHDPFSYHLACVASFPNGIIHTVPEPDEGFRALTATLRRVFPRVQPYRGEFTPAPHITLEAIDPTADLPGSSAHGIDERTVREALRAVLPVVAMAEAVDLVWYEQGNTALVRRFRLGC